MQEPALTWLSVEAATFWVTLVGAVGTVGALVVAIVLGVHEVRALRRDNAERAREQRLRDERERRSQAECVSGQLHVEREPSRALHLHAGALTNRHYAYAEVFNASALPVYNVQVFTEHPDHPGKVTMNAIPFIAGGQTGHVHTPPQPSPEFDGLPVGLRFRDAAGVRWHRHNDGVLHELYEVEDFEEHPLGLGPVERLPPLPDP